MINGLITAMTSMPSWLTRSLGFSMWDWGDDRYSRHLSSEKCLSNPAIWYGINKKAGRLAQLPKEVFRVEGDKKTSDTEHNIYKLLKTPNAYQTSAVFFEQFFNHNMLDGNGRAAIVRRGNRIMELIPLLPECTITVMIGGMKLHATRPEKDDRLRLFFPTISDEGDKVEPEGIISLNDSDVVHVPGLSIDGISGLPLRRIGQRNINAAISCEERISRQYEHGFTGNIVIEAPQGMFRNKKDAEDFLDDWRSKHHKKEKSGEPAILREGMKLTVVQTSNKDAEMVDNRKFQRQDMAMYLGLESIHGDNSNAFNSIRERNQAELLSYGTLITKCEQEFELKLLPTKQYQSGSHIIRFDVSEFYKSDWFGTLDAAGQAVVGTLISRNEGRGWIGLNPVPGGDTIQNPQPGGGGIEPDEDEAATTARLAHLIGVESGQVITAARQAVEKNRNFVAWLDDFYAKKWEPKLADWIEELGMDRDHATAHCKESKRRILEACDRSTNDDLVENVSAVVQNWKLRANQIGKAEYV